MSKRNQRSNRASDFDFKTHLIKVLVIMVVGTIIEANLMVMVGAMISADIVVSIVAVRAARRHRSEKKATDDRSEEGEE